MAATLHPTIPAARSRVIGREVILGEIHERLAVGDARLLTLTGVGGIGKTTIAAEVARAVVAQGGREAAFVDLATARDLDDAVLRCSDALGLIQQGRPPIATLVDHLGPRDMLLVLDNCEHLVRAIRSLLDRMLDRCPDLRILATSRVPLRVRGEAVLVIPPMPLPDPAATGTEAAASSPAVALFAERAAAADASLTLDAGTLAAVAAICRHVDGIPLAVELVAAQAGALTPQELEVRLRTRAGLGERVGPDASRLMAQTLDWSHDLLSPAAQTLFRRLSVFTAGWTLEAAEHVGSLGDGRAPEITAALVELVEHSLVERGWREDASRYRLLMPVAQYAMTRLDDPEERDAAAAAHAAYYLNLVSSPAAAFPMSAPEQLELVANDYDNCEAAMRFAEDARLGPVVTGFALALLTFWGVRGLLHTAVRRLESALAVVGPGETPGRAVILGGLAAYHRLLGRHTVAAQQAAESERVFEGVHDRTGQATAIGLRGEIATDLEDFPTAYAHYDRARAVLGPDPDPLMLAVWHGNVAGIALRAGDDDRARRELDRALKLLGDRPTWYLVQLLVRLGRLERLDGQKARAATHLLAGLRATQRFGARVDGIICLEELARLAMDQGDAERGVIFLAAARAIRDATALHLTAHDRRLLAADIERARSVLSAEAFESAWGLGRDMTLDQVIDLAASRGMAPVQAVAPPRGSVLTRREEEIARFIALGLTNKAIAARLGIASSTVRVHVERILDKLGCTSRVQVATWVVSREHQGVA